MQPLDSSTVERVSAAEPQWLQARRNEAYAAFSALELPSDREEIWKYVDLDFDLGSYGLPTKNGALEPSASGMAAAIGDAAGRATVVDGVVTAVDGDHVSSLAGALERTPERLAETYGAAIPVGHDIFTAAHHAFAPDGVVISLPRNTAATNPIVVRVDAATSGAISFPHVLVDMADGAQASVVIEYTSSDAVDALVAPHVEAVLGANSNLDLTIVQGWGYATTALAQSRITVGRDSNLRIAEAGLGGSLSRLHLSVDLEGQGSSAQVLGAYFGEQEQTLDYRYFMRHIGENTNSDMFLKGAVEDDALSVFTGMIRIEETAQRTDAFQTNRNLILSDGAAAQSVPNLEILANDVRCGHGSTVGPLDAEQRYYLMSRGLDRQRSDRLQVHGFFEEVLARFPVGAIAAPVRDAINAKYIAAQREGRLA